MPTIHLPTKGSHNVLMLASRHRWHWLLGFWPAEVCWDESFLASAAPAPSSVSLWQYLTSHPRVSAPHPRALPGAEAKMWPVLTLQLQLKLSRQLRNLQNSVLILNLSVLLHRLRSLRLETQTKGQGNMCTWEKVNSGRSLNLHNFPCCWKVP